MKTLSATVVARNFSAVLDALERDQEEIVLVRNQRPVARLVPETTGQDALSVFGDLYRTLDDATAEALSRRCLRDASVGAAVSRRCETRGVVDRLLETGIETVEKQWRRREIGDEMQRR
jgi:antitoxin (DNA-binding transcriptional repressor) of toxin-antitoxin stability system